MRLFMETFTLVHYIPVPHMDIAGILISLFLTAFTAATVFPAQSETVLAALLLHTAISPWILVTVASAGNILGSCVNWAIGRCAEIFKDRTWFPVSAASMERAQARYKKYGRWSLLLSWVPFIGDPITIAAGVMRENFWVFLMLVSIAKIGRYIVLALITLNLL